MPASTNPLVLKLGADLLRFRAVVTSAEQVKEVEVRGWDTATKQALTATKPGRDDLGRAARRRPGQAGQDVRRRPLRVDRRPAPHPGRGRRGRRGARRGGRRARSPSSRASPGATRRCAPARRSPSTASARPFDGKYTVTTSRHRLDPATGYTTSFSVTGVRDRTLLGLAGGGGPATTAPAGRRGRPSSTTSTTRRRPAGCGCASPGWPTDVRQRLGPHRAGRRRQGPGRAGPARGGRRGAGRLRAGRLPASVRARRPLQRRRPARRPGHRRSSTAARARSTGARWCPGAGTGSTCSTRTAGPRASPSPAATASSA